MPAPHFMPVDASDNPLASFGTTSSGAPGFVQIQDGASTRLATVTAGNAVKVDGSAVTQPVTTGGTTTAVVAAGTATDTPVKASAGRLCRVLVTSTAGAAATVFYDNAATGTGTVIGIFPASVAVGAVSDFGMPAANGITLKGAATNPAMTISFT